jgi:hypothetical protein
MDRRGNVSCCHIQILVGVSLLEINVDLELLSRVHVTFTFVVLLPLLSCRFTFHLLSSSLTTSENLRFAGRLPHCSPDRVKKVSPPLPSLPSPPNLFFENKFFVRLCQIEKLQTFTVFWSTLSLTML